MVWFRKFYWFGRRWLVRGVANRCFFFITSGFSRFSSFLLVGNSGQDANVGGDYQWVQSILFAISKAFSFL